MIEKVTIRRLAGENFPKACFKESFAPSKYCETVTHPHMSK